MSRTQPWRVAAAHRCAVFSYQGRLPEPGRGRAPAGWGGHGQVVVAASPTGRLGHSLRRGFSYRGRGPPWTLSFEASRGIPRQRCGNTCRLDGA